MNSWLWLFMLLGSLAVSLLGLAYLVSRFEKFTLLQKLSGGRRGKRVALAVLCVVLLALIVGGLLGFVNLCVVMVYLSLFWIAAELLIKLLRHLHVQLPFAHGYAAGILALAVTAGYLGYAYWNDHKVVLTEYTVPSAKITQPVKLALFSDAHMGTTFDGEGFQQYIDRMNDLSPDAVLIAGDFIDGSSKYDDIVKATEALRGLDSTYGTYFVFGNHDKNHYGEDKKREFTTEDLRSLLEENGVTVLEDQVIALSNELCILGRRDKQEASRMPIEDLVREAEPGCFLLDMNHQPNDYSAEAEAGVDLVVSGHTHGGQLLLIRDIGLWIGASDRIYGMERRGSTSFIVSSGISDWALDFKTGCGSEIVLINLVPEI